MKIDAVAAAIPPIRQLIRLGATFEKSNAGDTKFATMLIPIVAIVKVNAPRITAVGWSIRPTVSTGSVINCPKTGSVAAVVTTVTSENARKLTGRPQKLPRFTLLKLLQ